MRLFQTLPAATKNREEALKDDDFALDGSAYDDDDEEDEWAGDDNTWAEEEEQEEEQDAKDESSAYLEFLNEEAKKFKNLEGDESDDELGEESLLETPLDKIEPYQLFKNALMSMLTSYYLLSRIMLTRCRTPNRTAPTLPITYHKSQS